MINKNDIKNFLEKNNFHTKKVITITKKKAQKWTKKDVICFIACLTLNFRPLAGAIENANYWNKKHTKDEIINQFFKKDYEKIYGVI